MNGQTRYILAPTGSITATAALLISITNNAHRHVLLALIVWMSFVFRSTKTLITTGRVVFLRTLALPSHSILKYCLKPFCFMASNEDTLAPLRAAVKEQVTTIRPYTKMGMLCVVLGRYCETIEGRKAAKDGDHRGSS